ncbi:MAG: NRDE family protein [Desulfuromonadales bacterium]
MCLILIAHQFSKERPLVVLANRDEFYQRPTAAAGPWQECPEMIAGRDLASGGTWFGVRGRRWAGVTNVREGFQQGHSSHSRGWLVRDYLLGQDAAPKYLAKIAGDADQYAGFNLLLGDGDTLWFGSNRGPTAKQLSPGLYGLSNHQLDTPWPKVRRGKAALRALLTGPSFTIEDAFAILTDTTQASDAELPDTGVPQAWERALSAAFIDFDDYGTRSSTVLIKTAAGTYHFIERSYNGSPRHGQEKVLTWRA